MKKHIWLLVFLLAPVMAQERLAIEDFQVPATLSVSGTELSTRLKQIAEQYSTKYQIVISEGTIKEIRERIKTEYQLGVKPDINP
ncbi:secreted protein, partial [Candidatus Thiomargarita nelsonii]